MATIKTRIKKAFKNETLEEIRAWNMDSGPNPCPAIFT